MPVQSELQIQCKEPEILLFESFLANPGDLFDTLRTGIAWDTSMAARHTASFGKPYNYSQMSYEACPIHPALIPVADSLFQVLDIEFNNCLLNYYLSGESKMGFHSDDISDLQAGTGVAIVSLGSERGITYRSKARPEIKFRYRLPPGSLLYMDAQVQNEWMHAIKKEADAGPRISLTWRAFK